MIGFIVFIIGVVLLGGGIIFLADRAIRKRDISDDEPAGRRWPGVTAILGGVIVIIMSFGLVEVPAGSVGVKTRFGQVDSGTLYPGLHLVIPVAESITMMDSRVRVYGFDQIESFTRENQPAILKGIVQFHIDPVSAPELYSTVGPDYQSKLIDSQADTKLKALARLFGVDEITSRRDELAAEVMTELQTVVDPYDITIDGVFIRDIGLSADYLGSVEQKQIASQNLSRAKTEADTLRTKAQGEADAQAIIADGQARANERIVQSLTPELIQWETIHKLADKVRIALVPSDSGFIWNLNGITADETAP